MRPGLSAVLVAMVGQAVGAQTVPRPSSFRYDRAVEMVDAGSARGVPRACAVIDGAVYQHAQPALGDLRLMNGGREIPYALTMSETSPQVDQAGVMDVEAHGSRVSFDLQMPQRAYTKVNLDLAGKDFVLAAKVTGVSRPGQAGGTDLGSFTLFDLSGRGLSRDTSLPLQETTFPYLHVELTGQVSAAMVRGAEVPASREAQTLYTKLASTSELQVRGRDSVAVFAVPAHVPVERVSVELAPGERANFDRRMRVVAQAEGGPGEEIDGEIDRVRLAEAGQTIRDQVLSVPAIVGANSKADVVVEVSIENGAEPPLAIQSVKLEMRERKLCFDVPGGPLRLFYGDDKLPPPAYDYTRTFRPDEAALRARLDIEHRNPAFVARVEPRRFRGRHPELLWLLLLSLVSMAGVMGFHWLRGGFRFRGF